MKLDQKKVRLAELLLLLVVAVVNLLPIAWGVVTSLKSGREVLVYPPKLFGFQAVLDNYLTVIRGGFLHAMWDSVLYSLAAIVIDIVIGMLAAYAIKRYRFPLKKAVFYMIVAGIPLSIGSAALVIPNYIFFSKLGMVDRWYTLPLIYAAYNLPMAAWIMMGGMENIPYEIEEAAQIDGCSRAYIIFRLIPRLNSPAIASAALFVFIGAWNEFIVASVMINSIGLRSVQQEIYNYMGFFGLDWGLLTAASTIAVIPTLLIFCFLGKYMISGITAGSVKG